MWMTKKLGGGRDRGEKNGEERRRIMGYERKRKRRKREEGQCISKEGEEKKKE